MLLYKDGNSVGEVVARLLHLSNHGVELLEVYDVFRCRRVEESLLMGYSQELEKVCKSWKVICEGDGHTMAITLRAMSSCFTSMQNNGSLFSISAEHR